METQYIGDLILLRGLPGSGKTTLGSVILKAFTFDNLEVISADDYFFDEYGNEYFNPGELGLAHAQAELRCANKMKVRNPKIVVANTFIKEKELDVYYELAERYNYRVHVVVVENRHGSKSVHGVSDTTMAKMKRRFSPPQL